MFCSGAPAPPIFQRVTVQCKNTFFAFTFCFLWASRVCQSWHFKKQFSPDGPNASLKNVTLWCRKTFVACTTCFLWVDRVLAYEFSTLDQPWRFPPSFSKHARTLREHVCPIEHLFFISEKGVSEYIFWKEGQPKRSHILLKTWPSKNRTRFSHAPLLHDPSKCFPMPKDARSISQSGSAKDKSRPVTTSFRA